MAPTIQYARTSDGVSVAYYATGSGPALPVVWIALPSHLQLERKRFRAAVGYRLMTPAGTLVRYDHRGFGLSDRSITKFPLDDLVKDLEAVVDKLAFEKLALVASGDFPGPVAITYAAAHPDRVSKLVCWGGASHVPAALHRQVQALMLPNSDWRDVSETVARLVGPGWDDDELARQVAAWFRDSSTYETFKNLWQDMEKWDVRGLLPAIQTPTLILAEPGDRWAGVEQAQETASAIPDAQLVIGEGATLRERAVYAAMASFLYGPANLERPQAERTGARSALPSGTAVILFADIVDSTALTERLGDTAFRDKARDLDGALRTVIREHSGTPIEGKLLGDGVLAVFTSARQAIEAALACGRSGADAGLPLHLGLHAGDVIRESDPDGRSNVYGGAVNIASRISGLSAPGEVLVSDTVRSLARTSAGVTFEDRGEHTLKGVGDTVRLWAVREGE